MPDVAHEPPSGLAPVGSAVSTSVLRRAARGVRVLRARRDFTAFCEFVLRDESTGAPLILSPMHREWAQLLAAHDRLQILAHVESGKSNLVTVGWVLFQLGRNPNLRVCLISNTGGQSEKLLRAVARQIERNEALREVFHIN